MKGPRQLVPYEDAQIDCEEALEPAVIELANLAERAGWTAEIIWAAVGSLADNLALRDQVMEEDETRMAEAARRTDP